MYAKEYLKYAYAYSVMSKKANAEVPSASINNRDDMSHRDLGTDNGAPYIASNVGTGGSPQTNSHGVSVSNSKPLNRREIGRSILTNIGNMNVEEFNNKLEQYNKAPVADTSTQQPVTNGPLADIYGNLINADNTTQPTSDVTSTPGQSNPYSVPNDPYADKLSRAESAFNKLNTAYFSGKPINLTDDEWSHIQDFNELYYMVYKAESNPDTKHIFESSPNLKSRMDNILASGKSHINKDTHPNLIRGYSDAFRSWVTPRNTTPQGPDDDGKSPERSLFSNYMQGVADQASGVLNEQYTNVVTNGIKQGIQDHKPYLYGNYQEWADLAVDQGVLPEWLKPFTKDKFMFWGSIAGVGALAVGGLSAVVRSFLGGRDQDPPRRQSPNNAQFSSTSMWRA